MDFCGTQPIWQQLEAEFERRIVIGDWMPAAKLPSVRELALEYRVNPNTVQRALAELDRAGVTRSERTAGRYVTDDRDVLETLRTTAATGPTREYIRKLRGLNIDRDAAHTLLDTHWRQS